MTMSRINMQPKKCPACGNWSHRNSFIVLCGRMVCGTITCHKCRDKGILMPSQANNPCNVTDQKITDICQDTAKAARRALIDGERVTDAECEVEYDECTDRYRLVITSLTLYGDWLFDPSECAAFAGIDLKAAANMLYGSGK